MNCPKCRGLVEEDRDPESLTTRRCINCGWRGNLKQENYKKPRCEDPSAPDSVSAPGNVGRIPAGFGLRKKRRFKNRGKCNRR